MEQPAGSDRIGVCDDVHKGLNGSNSNELNDRGEEKKEEKENHLLLLSFSKQRKDFFTINDAELKIFGITIESSSLVSYWVRVKKGSQITTLEHLGPSVRQGFAHYHN